MKLSKRMTKSFIASIALPLILSGCLTDPVESSNDTPTNTPLSGNNAPQITGTPPSVIKVGVTYSFIPTASDPDSDALVFNIQNMPVWAEFDQSTGRMAGIPLLGHEGTYSAITISASDGSLSTDMPEFSVTVEPATAPNMPPEISGVPNSTAAVGENYLFAPSVSDPDGDLLTYTVQNLPLWATFNSTNGMLSGIPQTGDEGAYTDISITVSDGVSDASLPAFSIQVTGLNAAPTISGTPDSQITAGQIYSFTPTAADPDNDTLVYSEQNMPLWLSFDAGTGSLTGTPQADDVGSFTNIVIEVSDGTLFATLPAFSITVNASNSPPNISGTPESAVVAGENYSFTPTAADPDGDPISFSIANAPSWSAFDAGTGTMSGTPQTGDIGSYTNIVISVADNTGTSSLPAFAINVNPANSAPVISGTPANAIAAGDSYNFAPTASDPDGDTLVFSIQNRPTWLSFNTSTGALQGTPGAGDAGNHDQIGISVSDGSATASLPVFAINVTVVNSAPQISGSPTTQINAGGSYTFTPTATDADDDALTFSIQNAPAWATFDENTGTLSGTTSAANVGTYANIQISVSDGNLTTALGAFGIQVSAVSLGSATLSWTPPTLNTDGSPLTDLDAYVVYYGTAPNALNTSARIDNPGITSFMVDGLAPATYYFAITSVNSEGVESSFSNTASKVVN